jgi:hypothetical protein
MKDFRYTETATITISRNVLLQANDNIEALDLCNVIMPNNYDETTDRVIKYKTDEWKLEEVSDGTN